MQRKIMNLSLGRAAAGLAAGLTIACMCPGAAQPSTADVPGGIPLLIPDESAGDWVVERFAGNSTAGYAFSQGPAAEAGGIGRPAIAIAPDGTAYLATGGMSWIKDMIVRVAPDGTLRLLAGGGSSLADGPASKARIAVDWRGGGLVPQRRQPLLRPSHGTGGATAL